MLRINRKTDYAIRVMVALAERTGGQRTSSMEIQKEMLIPHAYLQRIIADLSRSQLILTYPGPNGGLQLARPKESITLRDVYESIEGPLLISECLERSGECPLDVRCPVHSHWERLQARFVQELQSITLKDLSEEALQLAAAH